jgi:hypothetical protein
MKLYELTTFQFEVLMLADSGAAVSVSEMLRGLESEDPMGWLADRFEGHRFGRGFGPNPKLEELNNALMRHSNVLEGVSNNGVLFLAAVLNNIIAAEEWDR